MTTWRKRSAQRSNISKTRRQVMVQTMIRTDNAGRVSGKPKENQIIFIQMKSMHQKGTILPIQKLGKKLITMKPVRSLGADLLSGDNEHSSGPFQETPAKELENRGSIRHDDDIVAEQFPEERIVPTEEQTVVHNKSPELPLHG